MNRRFYYLLLAVPLACLQAQTPVAPTPLNPPETIDLSNFKVSAAFEAGYRFSRVGGDGELYRSNVNYGNGIRMLNNTFSANSKDGHGLLFDTLLFSSQGLGNDPYQTATAHVEKNGLYRYDGAWRAGDYSNPFNLSGESGTMKTTHRDMEDHDLSLTAAKWLKLRLGYSRYENRGPAVSNYQLYIGGIYPLPTSSEPGATHGSSILPLQTNMRQDSNDYRFGTDFDFKSFRLSITRQLSYYKEDSSYDSLNPGQPYPLINTSVATSYWRSAPMHVRSPTWLGNLSTNHKLWAMNARVSYMKSDSTFVYNEKASGTLTTGTVTSGQISAITFNGPASVATFSPGSSRRPYISGDYSFSYLPTDKFSIVSSTSVLSNRTESTAQMLQTSTAAATKNIFWGFQLDVARFSESLDLNYRIARWLGLNANYLYSDRSVDQRTYRVGTTNSNALGSIVNHLNAETAGFRLKPLKPLSISLDAGIGSDNGPYTPQSMANYHTLRGRIDYRLRGLRFSGTYRQLYNLNAPAQYAAVSYDTQHSRSITTSASYESNKNWSVDASYSKLHQDTFSTLYAELPSAAGPITNVRGYNSVYLCNVHSVSIMTRSQFGRATITLGYNLTRDTGDGRNTQSLGLNNVALAYLAGLQTFPLTYQAPMARLSIRLLPKMQWNLGWQFYRYNQQFATLGYQPYYRAQTGFTSILFTY